MLKQEEKICKLSEKMLKSIDDCLEKAKIFRWKTVYNKNVGKVADGKTWEISFLYKNALVFHTKGFCSSYPRKFDFIKKIMDELGV